MGKTLPAVEVTREMIEAGRKVLYRSGWLEDWEQGASDENDVLADLYRAMNGAALASDEILGALSEAQ